MSSLRLLFFDRPEVYLDDVPVHQALPDKAVALLCYLALTRTAHTRTKLAATFWGNKLEKRARNNLSIVLNQLGDLKQFLDIRKKTVGLDLKTAFQIDVQSFEAIVSQVEAAPIERLQQAADQYRGKLLENFHLSDEDGAHDFLEWLQKQQIRLEQSARKLLHLLAVRYIESRNVTAAIVAAERAVGIDPWREEAHRQLMRLYAHADQKERAIDQFRRCQLNLSDELGVDVSAETQELYNAIVNDEMEPLETIAEAPFEAPALPRHLVGRQTIISHANRLRVAMSGSVMALVGMGGIGKSTVASVLAHAWREIYADGVLWTHANDEDLFHVLQRWAERYDRDLTHLKSLANRTNAMRDILSEKQILVVFDSAAKAAALRGLVPSNNNSLILITTRQHDIAAALSATLVPIALLEATDSLLLLQAIVGRERISAELDAAQQICALLEHLPLALEIVAQRLRARPAYTLAMLLVQLQQLQSRLPLLEIGDRAVRVSFEASWAMLPGDLQNLYRALAPFAGRRFTVAALIAVTQQSEWVVTSALMELMALSLLAPAAEKRYRQHALLADFAFEKATHLAIHQQRMVDYFLAYATQHADEPLALQLEWHNLVASMTLAHTQAARQTVIEFAQTLAPTFSRLGQYHDARALLPLARTAAQALNEPIQEAQILLEWGTACIEQNDYDDAQALLDDGLRLAQTADHQKTISDLLLALARIAIERGDNEQAHQWLIEARSLAEKSRDTVILGQVHYGLARLYLRHEDLEAAEEYIHAALVLQEDRRPHDHAESLQILVTILLRSKRFDEAYRLSKQALAKARDLKNKDLIVGALYVMLMCAARCGDHRTVDELSVECLQLFTQMGRKEGQGALYFELSMSKQKRGDFADALELVDKSAHILETLNAQHMLIYSLIHRGDVLVSLNRPMEALSCWQSATAHAIESRHPAIAQLKARIASLSS